MSWQSFGLGKQYRDEVRRLLAPAAADAPLVVLESDLAHVPKLVADFVRRSGAVGRPRVLNLRATFHARMRNGRNAPWMDATVEQVDTFAPCARVFLMTAKRGGVPFLAYHRYIADTARMTVRLAGVVPLFDVSGDTMTQSETVTLLNDMCVLAPAALPFAAIVWEPIDRSRVRARFSNAGHSIAAELIFDASGDLVDFRSEDRHQNDGKQDRLLPWRTPLRHFQLFGAARLAAVGEAQWEEPDGTWTYGHFMLKRVEYNVQLPRT